MNGPRAGSNFLMSKEHENRIGRDVDCGVVLSDPLCSRVHASISADADGWWVCDKRSRNGTYLNEQKIDEARLVDGCRLRVGSSEFSFHESSRRPTDVAHPNFNLSKTIEFDRTTGFEDSDDSGPFPWLPDEQHSHDFLVIMQLCIRLLSCSDPKEVLSISLSVLHQVTGSAVTGFLWMSDDGHMRLKAVEPPDAFGEVVASDSLTEIVCGHRKSVWKNRPTASVRPQALEAFSDAMCVPVCHPGSTPAAIHMYKSEGEYQNKDFQFAKSVARIMAAALASTHQQASLQAEHQRLLDKSAHFDELIGESPPMLKLKELIRRVARATGCLLIRGESGAGKELVARAVHKHGGRADRPMLSVNCAAIPRELIESQLFGYRRGAFTGADADHAGWFEQADSGTLFLDEVGELTLDGQAKLLRVLDGYPFLPVGGTKEISVDVRVIAATNRDLAEFVKAKRFREDLYYRLTVFELYIPPLRERGDDIGLLIDSFLDRFKIEHGRPNLTLSAAAREKLLSYHWPGNVRQLRNVLDSATVLAPGDSIEPQDLGLRDLDDTFGSLRIDHWEKKLIKEALSRSQDNVPEAAQLLGMSRATLYRKIDEYGIPRAD